MSRRRDIGGTGIAVGLGTLIPYAMKLGAVLQLGPVPFLSLGDRIAEGGEGKRGPRLWTRDSRDRLGSREFEARQLDVKKIF